jgi:hypothetical protein
MDQVPIVYTQRFNNIVLNKHHLIKNRVYSAAIMVNFPSRSELAAPFRSKEAFVNFVKSPESTGGHTRVGSERWSNKDLEPTPPEHRNWTW